MALWKKMALPAVFVVALVALSVRLNSGIWDPWEMNRAHVARQIAGLAKVLVVEASGDILADLQVGHGHAYFFVGLGEPIPAKGAKGKGVKPETRVFQKAEKKLETEVFHGIVVDALLLTAEPTKSAYYLTRFKDENPGAAIYLFADDNQQCEQALAAVERGMVEEAGELLKSSYRLLSDQTDLTALATQHAGAYPFSVDAPCLVKGSEEIEAGLASLNSIKWSWVQIKGTSTPSTKKNPKPDRSTYLVPPLDYWLTAGCYKVFGFSETSSRLPAFVFGFFTLVILVFGLRRLTDGPTALLAAIVALSMPMFFGQAKNMAGEMSYAFWLTCSAVLFALLVKEGFSIWKFLGLVAAALLLFLAKGLFGLLCLLLLVGGYALVARDFRAGAVLLPLATLGLLFGAFMIAVQVPDEWTFFTHFKLMNRPFMGGPIAEMRTYEFFVRQVAFGVLPWTLILPFAMARLVPWGEDPSVQQPAQRVNVLVLLWFAVPFVLHSAMLHDFLHMVFPSAAAVAVAVALMWRAEGTDGRVNRFQAVVAVGIAAVLLANLFKSPAPLLSYLTLDPQLGAQDAYKFPPDFVLGTAVKGLLALITLVFFVFLGRGGTIYKNTAKFFRGRKAFWAALWVLASAFVLRLVVGLASRYSLALGTKEAAKLPPEYLETFNELFRLRPESIMLYIALAAYVLAAVLVFTRTGAYIAGVLRILSPLGRTSRFAGELLRIDVIGLTLAGMLALAALVVMLATFELPEGFLSRLWTMPSVLAALGIALLAPLVAAGVKFVGARTGRPAVAWASVLRVLAGGVIVATLVVTSTLFRQTDMSSPDIWLLSLASFCVLGLYSLPRLLASPVLFHAVGWGLLAAVQIVFFFPLALKWPFVESVAFPKAQASFLKYLLLESRLTWGPVVLFFLFVANHLLVEVTGFFRSFRPVDKAVVRLGRANPMNWPEQLERKGVFLVVVLALSATFGLVYAIHILPGFSREVSQKHILELYYASEDRTDMGDDIFKYQKKATGPAEDTNFYTSQIPAITSQQDLTTVLLGQADALVKATRSSSHPGPERVLVRGFDPANDVDADGVRDFQADAGLVSAVSDKVLEDASKEWESNQWKGYVLVDWRGNTIDILGNDATTLELALTPPINMGRTNTLRYVIDHPDAPNHKASAMIEKRNYIILSQEAFSSVNFSFRAKSGSSHIPVLDGTNGNFLLAASYLMEGEKNHNRFANATIPGEHYDALAKWTADPSGESFGTYGVPEELGAHGPMKSGYINFQDQIKFLGYQMANPSPARGDKIALRLFFECTGKISTSWKIFIHMDSTAASNRIHGDHWPLNLSNDPEEKQCVGCWRTNHWSKGDIILDDYKTEVPLGSPAGIYNLYMGFYTPGSDKRLKVKDYDKKRIRHDGKDRVFIGTFEVH